MRIPAPRLPVLVACVAFAACRTPEPAATPPRPAMEVRYVEASGPPKQDPTPPAPATRPEDPQDPAVLLEETRRELEREQQRRRDAERSAEKLDARIRELEARVLSLSLERARLEQEVLRLRIDALRAELDELGEPEPNPRPVAAPAGPQGPPRPGQGR